MTASDNLGHQWQQLPMFMPAKEIRNNYRPGDFAPEKTAIGDKVPEDTWNRKVVESKRTGINHEIAVKHQDGSFGSMTLYDHIKAKGVSSAVFIQDHESARGEQPKLLDGHHRVASAAESRPDDLIPVLHAESMQDRMKYKNSQRKSPVRIRRG